MSQKDRRRFVVNGTLRCNKCLQFKLLELFRDKKPGRLGINKQSICRSCEVEYGKAGRSPP